VNFTQLKFVQATANLKSFTKAADSCYVTQPTLSNGISKLEEELGEKIFNRTTRTVKLTKFGEALLPTMQAIVNLEKVLYTEAKEFSNPETIVFKIGMSSLMNTKFIALLTNSYKNQSNGVEILLIEENLDELEKKLKQGELDLILVPIINKKVTKKSIFLYDEELFFIDIDKGNSEQIQLKDIREKTFVMVPDSCGLSEITRSLLRTTRHEIKEYEGKALSCQVLIDWASNGLGSAILPKSKIMPHISKQQIFSANKPAMVSFQAKWLSDDNNQLKLMIEYFEKNVDEISKGIAD